MSCAKVIVHIHASLFPLDHRETCPFPAQVVKMHPVTKCITGRFRDGDRRPIVSTMRAQQPFWPLVSAFGCDSFKLYVTGHTLQEDI